MLYVPPILFICNVRLSRHINLVTLNDLVMQLHYITYSAKMRLHPVLRVLTLPLWPPKSPWLVQIENFARILNFPAILVTGPDLGHVTRQNVENERSSADTRTTRAKKTWKLTKNKYFSHISPVGFTKCN